jgi:hypothetical protein
MRPHSLACRSSGKTLIIGRSLTAASSAAPSLTAKMIFPVDARRKETVCSDFPDPYQGVTNTGPHGTFDGRRPAQPKTRKVVISECASTPGASESESASHHILRHSSPLRTIAYRVKPDCGYGLLYLVMSDYFIPATGLIWVSQTPPTRAVTGFTGAWQLAPRSLIRQVSSSGCPEFSHDGVVRYRPTSSKEHPRGMP